MIETILASSVWAFWIAVVSLISLLLIFDTRRKQERYPGIFVLFFFSGFPALLYQIVWQRALFSIYGVNIESVTVVVTAFMLGLGLGSLLGGQLSRRSRLPLPALFGILELATAVYGIFSLRLFHWVASFTAGASFVMTSAVAFVIVLVPTLLMGSTLPLLVAHMVKLTRNVGRSVGKLYFVNTLGSAIACFFAVVAMRVLGEAGSVLLAAGINACVGACVLLYYRTASAQVAAAASQGEPPQPVADTTVPFPLAATAAALAGFIALGYEILWYRVFSVVTGGLAKSFAELLGSYLAGIALGSLMAETICRKYLHRDARHWLGLVGQFVVIANVIGFFVIPSLAGMSRWVSYQWTFLLVVLAAAALGATFPLIAHISIPADSHSGARLSYLYLSNIVGSAAGSFVVGFVLMDHWTLSQISLALALAGVSIGAVLLARALRREQVATAMAACATVAIILSALINPVFHRIYERLSFRMVWKGPDGIPAQRFRDVIETKSGVITVTESGLVFGDGALEARLTTDLGNESAQNFLIPPYSLSSFHPDPKRILMIGLGSGAWAEIVANHPQLEKLTIIEINPGYLQLIPRYPQVAGLLKNSKVEIVIDDGRRWLVRNPDKKFDVVVMNTRTHFRDHASALLSVEFDELVRAHLNRGGALLYNTTFSNRALLTGATVFRHAVRLRNCLVASDSPILIDKERWRRVLLSYDLQGRPLFDPDSPQDSERLERLLSLADSVASNDSWDAMESGDSLRRRFRGLKLITDDNMGDEWPGHEWF